MRLKNATFIPTPSHRSGNKRDGVSLLNSADLISTQGLDRVGLQNERHADGQDGARLPEGHRSLQPRSVELPPVPPRLWRVIISSGFLSRLTFGSCLFLFGWQMQKVFPTLRRSRDWGKKSTPLWSRTPSRNTLTSRAGGWWSRSKPNSSRVRLKTKTKR